MMTLLADAQARLRQSPQADLSTEVVSLAIASGRIAARDVISELAIPPADNSAMDGFAVRADELASGRRLSISQRLPAGASALPHIAGTAARIFTGANIPLGADAVVIQENCEFDKAEVGDQVTILDTVQPGDNVRPRGQDIQNGAVVIRQGQRLNAVDISLLASVGLTHIEVYQRLTVAVFSTGDELAEPGQALAEGQIYNSNRPLLLALCEQLGYQTVDCGIVADTFEDTKAALKQAAQQAHLILSSGGVSVGEEDHVKPAVEALGALDMWKIQIKPGKPMAYGHIDKAAFLGLPGNPVSSFVVFQLLGMPLMQALQGEHASPPKAFKVISGFDKKTTTREEYIRVKLVQDDQGNWVADRFPNLSSGVLSSLSWADGLVKHSIDCVIERGQPLEFLPLRGAML